jgi:hypothetical protein
MRLPFLVSLTRRSMRSSCLFSGMPDSAARSESIHAGVYGQLGDREPFDWGKADRLNLLAVPRPLFCPMPVPSILSLGCCGTA